MKDNMDQKRERNSSKIKNKGKKKCKYCDLYLTNLYMHENVHKGIKYKCTECVHESNDKANLVKHMKTKHFKEPSKCSTCNKEFKDIAARYGHQCQRSYCDQCENSYTRKEKLRAHIKSIHEGKKYPCPKCTYKANQMTHLRNHIIVKHPESEINIRNLQ